MFIKKRSVRDTVNIQNDTFFVKKKRLKQKNYFIKSLSNGKIL